MFLVSVPHCTPQIWADPKSCRTVKSSGLPVGRRVSVYSFAPPYGFPRIFVRMTLTDTAARPRCTTDVPLAKLAENLVVSFIYSHDLVSRLSIGTVMDLRNAALTLCMAEASENGDKRCGHSAVLERAGKWKSGFGSPDDENWVGVFCSSFLKEVQLTLGVAVHCYAKDP